MSIRKTDEELAAAARNGDDAAFQELMGRTMRHVYNFAYQYVRTAEDAEDVTQDSFFKVWKNIGSYKPGRQFKPWLFTIVRNTALDFLKKRRAAAFSDLDDDADDLIFADTLANDEPDAAQLFETAEIGAEVTAALDTLHPEHRSVLVLHYHEGLTFDEIAAVVGKPMNTVKSWHRRALLRLRRALPHRKPS